MMLIGMDCTARGLCPFAESPLSSAPLPCLLHQPATLWYPPVLSWQRGRLLPVQGPAEVHGCRTRAGMLGKEGTSQFKPQSIFLHLQSTTSSVICTFKKSWQTGTLLSAQLFLFQVYFTAAFVSCCH